MHRTIGLGDDAMTATTATTRRADEPATPTDDTPRDRFAATIRGELAPEGVMETLLADLAARSAWTLSDGSRRGAARAEQMLVGALGALEWLQARRARGPAVADGPARLARPPGEPADESWRRRLVFDAEVSETSPVVRGTWVTVNHVVSLVVDGWTWADILRAHPELTEADVRACLAYTTEEDGPASPEPLVRPRRFADAACGGFEDE